MALYTPQSEQLWLLIMCDIDPPPHVMNRLHMIVQCTCTDQDIGTASMLFANTCTHTRAYSSTLMYMGIHLQFVKATAKLHGQKHTSMQTHNACTIICVCLYIYYSGHMYTVHVCVCMCVCTCVCVCVCVCGARFSNRQVASLGQEDLVGIEVPLIVLTNGASHTHSFITQLREKGGGGGEGGREGGRESVCVCVSE